MNNIRIPQILLLDAAITVTSPTFIPITNTPYERQQDVLNYNIQQLVNKGCEIIDFGVWQVYESKTSFNKNTVLYIKYLKDV